jgi:hypothetical protein
LYRTTPKFGGGYSGKASKKIDLETVPEAMDGDTLDARAFLEHDFGNHPVSLFSLQALGAAGQIYDMLPCATASMKITTKFLLDTKWVPESRPTSWLKQVSLTRAECFSCVTLLETGQIDLDPKDLRPARHGHGHE